MLRAWNFTAYKLHRRYSDNSLQINFWTNIFESDTADTSESYFNDRIMIRQLTDLNSKVILSLLAAREISLLEF